MTSLATAGGDKPAATMSAATARALAAAGVHVVVTARKARDLEAVEEEIHAAGGSATIAPMDLTEGDSIGRLATAIHERWGRLDILVINAAMLPSLMPVESSEDYAAQLLPSLLTLTDLSSGVWGRAKADYDTYSADL